MAYDGSLIFDTELDSKGFQTGLSRMSSIATKGAAVIAAAIAGIGIASIKVGIDFESAFAGVKKTVDATDSQLATLRQGILDMAKEIPIAADEIAGIAEAAGQLGIKTENILDFTRTMADLGVATNMTSEEAATSLARLANITQMPQENFDRLGSVVVALGNNLATTESEIVDMGMRLAGAGAQIGMSEADIMAFSGALSSVGIEAEAGGSAISKVMVDMQLATETGGKALEQFAAVAGMSAEEFASAFKENSADALLSFIEGLQDTSAMGKSAIAVLDDMGISEVRMRDALLRASGAGDTFRNALNLSNQAWEENNALTNEASQRYETAESQIQLLKNSVSDIGIKIYDALEEPFKDGLKAVNGALDELSASLSGGKMQSAIQSLGDSLKTVMSAAATLAKTALPPLISAFSWLLQNAGKIAAGIVAIKTAMTMYSVTFKATAGFRAATKATELLWASAHRGISTTKFLTTTLSAQQVAVSTLTGRISVLTAAKALATKAQMALNAAWVANPIGLVVTAVATLAAGLGVLYLTTRDTTDSLNKSTKAVKENYEAWKEQKNTVEESVSADLAKLEHTQKLSDELRTLADEKGNVAEKDRERVSFILGELNSALGTEYSMVNGVIQGYDDLASSIDNVIAKKRAEIKIDSAKEGYEAAIKNLNDMKENLQDLEDKYKEWEDLYNSAGNKDSKERYAGEMETTAKRIGEATAKVDEYTGYMSKYEQAMGLFEKGSYADAESMVDMLVNLTDTANMSASEQVAYFQEQLANIDNLIAKAQESGASMETMNWLSGWREDIAGQLEELTGVAAEGGAKIDASCAEGIVSNTGVISTAVGGIGPVVDGSLSLGEIGKAKGTEYVSNLSGSLASGASSIDTTPLTTPFAQAGDAIVKNMSVQASTAVQQYVGGINNEMSKVKTAVQLLNTTITEGLAKAAQTAKTKGVEVGKNIAAGVRDGINAGKSGVVLAAIAMVNAANKAAKDAAQIKSPSKVFKNEVGKNIALGVAVGIEENADEATKAAVKLAKDTYEASKDFIDKEKYYDRMSLAEELQAWQRVQSQYIEGSQQRIDAEKEVYRVRKELISKIEDLEENYQNKLASRTKEIADGYDLFAEVKEPDDVSIKDLMYNSAQQELQLEEWTAGIAEMTAKATGLGLSDGFMEYVKDQDYGYLMALGDATDEQLITLAARYDNIQKMSADQAKKDLTGLREETDKQIGDLLVGVEGQFTEYAPAVGTALTDGMADGIANGMSKVINTAVKVAVATVQAVKDALEINSPSRRFRWLGQMSGQGLAVGLNDCIGKIESAANAVAAATIPANVQAGTIINNNNTNTVTHKETIVKEKTTNIRFSGSLAPIARLLGPELVKESNINGKAIVKRNKG